MTLKDLLQALGDVKVHGDASVEIEGVVCDSRHVRKGYLFVAIHGHRADGASFIDDAARKGAVAIVTESASRSRSDVSWVTVPQARVAAGRLAARFHGSPADRMTMVGVTGTNGKTTTSYMIHHVLRAAGRRPGLITTVDYEIGARTIPAVRTTPDAPTLQALLHQMESAGGDAVVMEVSSHALDQRRIEGVDYDVAVFTNLSRDHLDYHGSMEDYFGAKRQLFDTLDQGCKKGIAVINADDVWGGKLLAERKGASEWVSYGMQSEAMVCASDISLSVNGSAFHVATPWGETDVSLRLMGRYNISNALAAIAVCGSLGVGLEVIAAALEKGRSVPGRLEPVPTSRPFDVFVDYAHTDDALTHVLRTLREITRERLIVVFGCGGDRDRSKRPAMGAVASELADVCIITSDNPRSESPAEIIDHIRAGAAGPAEIHVIETRKEAIEQAVGMAGAGDVVVIAGKGHECFQEFANRTLPFDDRQVARQALEK